MSHELPSGILRPNMEQIKDNSSDVFHCLLNEMLVILQSTTDKDKFHERLSYLVCDTLANWHDLTAIHLLRRVLDGGLGKRFLFDVSEWFVKDMGSRELTITEIAEYACDRVRERQPNVWNAEYLDISRLQLLFRGPK